MNQACHQSKRGAGTKDAIQSALYSSRTASSTIISMSVLVGSRLMEESLLLFCKKGLRRLGDEATGEVLQIVEQQWLVSR
jgi:hypothetical protein